jgi:hypothetical protein
MNPVETYLKNLHSDYSSGAVTGETSGYGHLQVLLNELGKSLKPKVRCQIQLKNKGSGQPDGGFFTADQFRKLADEAPLEGQPPARGAIEIKGPEENLDDTIEDKQVKEVYLPKYRLVLATNYWDFRLLTQTKTGESQVLESFRLANSAEEFWRSAAHPQKAASELGEEFAEYLMRVMLHNAPLSEPKDVAWFLASYARDARARMAKAEVDALANIRTALEEALGLKFEGEKGEHFFRSTLVQTLFYGIFSAWVLWSKQKKSAPDRNGSQESFKATGHLAEPTTNYKAPNTPQSASVFDWRLTQYYLRVPILRKLFYEVADPGKLEAVKLSEVLEWSAAALNRVQSAEFFSKFEEEHAVQYFYEPFLEAFDPELRKDLGVWYTPREIVQYMVARVDTVLRTELDIADGLADPRVYVLDPCCGTGAYLVEVLKRIHQTLKEKGNNALVADELKNAAIHRVFGFEILPAPFVVSHLQIGLLLQNLDAPLAEQASERVGVYLTNSLTGWEPPKGPKRQVVLWPELEAERKNADDIKQSTPILVILGNPPYNGFAGVSGEEEEGLLDLYKGGLKEWGITKNYLDDLYVRFFRVAERRIAEKTRQGIVCYISNFSYVDDPTYVVMRKGFLERFNSIWIDSMNGDSRQTGKQTPEGNPDPSVFSTDYNREGIRKGTAISLFIRKQEIDKPSKVRFRHFWGVNKKADLLASLRTKSFDSQYSISSPDKSNRFSFRPSSNADEYGIWPSLAELCDAEPMLGLNDNRGQATHDFLKSGIAKRMKAYYDASISFEQIRSLHQGLVTNAAGFDAKAIRSRLQKESKFQEGNICRFWFKPFDLRWAYIERIGNLWNRIRPELLDQAWSGNHFLLSRRHAPKSPDGAAVYFSDNISDQHALNTDAYFIPVLIRKKAIKGDGEQHTLDFKGDRKDNQQTANLSDKAREYLTRLGIKNPDGNMENAALIWMHALAIGFDPLYLVENADGIRQDWPRVPLPKTESTLRYSASLGTQIAKLLDTETEVKGVTSGTIAPEMKNVAEPSHAEGKQLRADRGDLELTAGWGHGGKDGVTMPGKGKIVRRDYTKDELKALERGAKARGLAVKESLKHLGEATCDIYLNDVAYWKNVPEKVWDYTIGGYQVIKKWLSYREKDLLGRSLTGEEVKEVMNMARRISAILWLEPKLNENYRNVKKASWKW